MANYGLFSGTKSGKSVTVRFRLPYFTQWGQSLLVCGSEPLIGAWNVRKGLLLSPVREGNDLIWSGTISVRNGFETEYSYYVVDDEKTVLRWEMGSKRKLVLPEGIQNGVLVELHDLWQTGDDTLPFTSAFKDVIFGRSNTLKVERPFGITENKLDLEDSVLVHFKICCPNIEEDTSLYVIGSSTKLGKWKVQDALKLSHSGESIWHADCVLPKGDFPIKYKYCKYRNAESFTLETGPIREVTVESSDGQLRYIVLSDGMLRETPWRGAGVAVPMFSVRSETDVGVGEFLDLKLLVDWAVAAGFHLVQLLPINDTSVHQMWWDSYPYSSLSVFALHPLYLRLQALSEYIPYDIKEEIEKAKELLDEKVVEV